MNKTRGHSKLVSIGIALVLVLSLVTIALVPAVLAQGGATLTLSIDTDADTYCCCNNVTVNATITNTGDTTAVNVTASISWIPSGDLIWVSGGTPTAPYRITVGNMTAGNHTDVQWVLHCEGPGLPIITVRAIANNAAQVWQQKYIEQRSAELAVNITSPSKTDICERSWLVCSSHNVTFNITNIGCQAASLVTATIYPAADIEVVVNGVGQGGGVPWTTPTLGTIDPDESITYTVTMHCVITGLGSQIHIKTNGWDTCSNEQISEEHLHSDIVEINQYEPLEITCDVDTDYTKHCHNVTFTATAIGGLPPYSWNWTFGDDTSQAGGGWDGTSLDVSHHYTNNTTEAVVYEACVTVSDNCTYTATCCQNVTVYPALNASCEADILQTKVCHNVTFNGTGIGGLPYPNVCDDYHWQWDFGDTTTVTGDGYASGNVTHHYASANNYTAIFSIWDNCLGNNATCNVTIEVFPPLTANCTADPLQTKVCHNVTFNGTGVGGLPYPNVCNDYHWQWNFGDNTDPLTGDGYTSGNVTHHYLNAGNYTSIFTIWEDCMGNNATCNVTVEIFPPLSANCTADPNPTKVGDNVTFTGTGVGGLPFPTPCDAYNWTWTFGDGGSQWGVGYTSGPVSHGYATAGNYTAVFTIWDNCLGNNATCNVTVEVFPPLDVECGVEVDRVHVCHEAYFWAERVGGVAGHNYTWQWDFGDGGTSTEQNPTHIYMCVGNWTATVTLTDAELGNNATCNTTVEVYIEAPDLISPINMAQLTSKNVTFEWEDIGCCNYTLEVWQKEADGQQVWEVETGHDNQWTMCIFNGNWRWSVTATDSCNNTATSVTWFFQVSAPEPSVTVQSPNGGEELSCNSTKVITWTATPMYATIEIRYSSDGGATWTQVATGEANDGAYPWTVPCISSEQCLVMVIARDACQGEGADTSDDVFTITTEPAPITSYNITLAAGWNLVSLPLIVTNSSIAAVTASINATVDVIWHYDASTATWFWYIPGNPSSTLTTMTAGKGYWVYMDSADTLDIVGKELPDPPTVPPTYDVVVGWNLIGFKSTVSLHHSAYLFNLYSGGLPDYSVIWGYDASVPKYVNVFPMEQHSGNLEPGHGYWLYAKAAGTIVPIS